MGEFDGERRLTEQRRHHAELRRAVPSGQAERIRQRFDSVGFVPTGPGAERRLRDAIDKLLAGDPDLADRFERASAWTIDNSVHEYLFHAAQTEEDFKPGAFRTAAGVIWPPADDRTALNVREPRTLTKINAVFVMLEAADRIMTASEDASGAT